MIAKTVTTSILILAFTIWGNCLPAQTQDYLKSIQALERRISDLEGGIKEISDQVMKYAGDNYTVLQKLEGATRNSSQQIDTLGQKLSQLSSINASLEELRSRIASLESRIELLESRILELERRETTARESITKAPPSEEKIPSRQPVIEHAEEERTFREPGYSYESMRRPRADSDAYMFIIEARSMGASIQIRYYTCRRPPQEIRMADYMVRNGESVTLKGFEVLPAYGEEQRYSSMFSR